VALIDNLISYWKLDEASGDAVDAHGSNDLTDNATVGADASGVINGARDFEAGNSEYFSRADNADLSTGDVDFSFAAWVKFESLGGFPVIASKYGSGADREWFCFLNSTGGGGDGTLLFRVTDSVGGSTTVSASTFGALSTGTWYHVVVWHDATANQIGISVNDTANTAAHSTGLNNGAAVFALGLTAGGGGHFDGLMDEAGFWKRVLTSGDRTALYGAGSGIAYPFSGGAATTYTFTGPSSGVVNVASTNFTVTPDGDADGITVTPATDGAGSFTPSSVTFTGSGAETFTYTPTSTTGSPHTLSVTDDGGLTDPASIDYTVTAGTVAITTPAAHTVRKRTGATNGIGGTASIAVTGTYTGSPTAIEYSIDGGSNWATLDPAPSAGAYTGTIASVAAQAARYTVQVRFSNATGITASVANIGVGDVFGVAGQSNACGALSSNQSVYGNVVAASLFGNDYVWKTLADPTDSNTSQVDAVSADVAGGSFWPLLATRIMAYTGCPVAFIPCAHGGTTIADWQPGADHYDRTTLYGSMAHRCKNGGSGGVTAVLVMIGESDSVAATSTGGMYDGVDDFAAAVDADLSCPVFFTLMQHIAETQATQQEQDDVNAGIEQRIDEGNGVYLLADLRDISVDPADDFHFKTNAQAEVVASRQFVGIYEGRYDAASGGGDGVSGARIFTGF
jgi:hypothetical protein